MQVFSSRSVAIQINNITANVVHMNNISAKEYVRTCMFQIDLSITCDIFVIGLMPRFPSTWRTIYYIIRNRLCYYPGSNVLHFFSISNILLEFCCLCYWRLALPGILIVFYHFVFLIVFNIIYIPALVKWIRTAFIKATSVFRRRNKY
jgi:hypothetical protein